MGTKAIMPYNLTLLKTMGKLNYLSEVVAKECEFEKAYDQIVEVLSLEEENLNILPNLETVRQHIEKCTIKWYIGKWIVVYDLDFDELNYLEYRGLVPHYGDATDYFDYSFKE